MSGISGRGRRGPGRTSAAPAAARGAGEPLRFVIPSDYASGNKVQQQIMGEVEKLGYNEHSVFAIRLALEEAMINAIKHGNKLDATKSVRVEARITQQQAEIFIEDEGPGFRRADVPDPMAEENLEKPSGRGILLIESYMNDVSWSQDGRRVRLLKVNGKEAG